jgi:hypothetical protein
MSLLGKLRASSLAVERPADPWLAPLQRVRGKVAFDGLERVSTQTLLDFLDVPQPSRTAGTYRHLAKLMAELGWTAVRVRDLTRGRYKSRCGVTCAMRDGSAALRTEPVDRQLSCEAGRDRALGYEKRTAPKGGSILRLASPELLAAGGSDIELTHKVRGSPGAKVLVEVFVRRNDWELFKMYQFK